MKYPRFNASPGHQNTFRCFRAGPISFGRPQEIAFGT